MDDGDMMKKGRGKYAMVRGERGGGREKEGKVRGGVKRMEK